MLQEVVVHSPALLEDVIPLMDKPLYLFGHSLGALEAYETALALRARTGREPAGLVVSAHGAPSTLDLDRPDLTQIDEEALIGHLLGMDTVPVEVSKDPKLVNLMLPILKADFEILSTYFPQAQAPLACPLLACGGNVDQLIAPDDIAMWKNYTVGPCTLRMYDGEHFYFSAQPGPFAGDLQRWISPAEAAAA